MFTPYTQHVLGLVRVCGSLSLLIALCVSDRVSSFVAASGALIGFAIVNPGSMYRLDQAPTVTIEAPVGGTTAEATAIIGEEGKLEGFYLTTAGTHYEMPTCIDYCASIQYPNATTCLASGGCNYTQACGPTPNETTLAFPSASSILQTRFPHAS